MCKRFYLKKISKYKLWRDFCWREYPDYCILFACQIQGNFNSDTMPVPNFWVFNLYAEQIKLPIYLWTRFPETVKLKRIFTHGWPQGQVFLCKLTRCSINWGLFYWHQTPIPMRMILVFHRYRFLMCIYNKYPPVHPGTLVKAHPDSSLLRIGYWIDFNNLV